MTTPDYRIQFSPTPIDFTSLGLTGTAIDTFPAAGSPARFDWMRSMLLGLLSQQASYGPPAVFSEGTLWLDLNIPAIKIYLNSNWVPLADAVLLEGPQNATLSDFYAQFASANILPDFVFSGVAAENITTLALPSTAAQAIANISDVGALVFVNGLLMDPTTVTVSPLVINLTTAIPNGAKYVVIVRKLVIV